MTGYVTIYKPDLKFREFYKYREYYCGLCRTLGKRHGQSTRYALGYDMTFLAVLLDGVYDARSESLEFRCPVHPFSRKKALSNPFLDYAADMDLYMVWLKCLDDWKDDKNLVRGICAKLLSKKAGAVEREYPETIRVVNEALEELHCMEKEDNCDFETAAGCFGRALGAVFRYGGLWDDTLEKMGFYLGKYIYLLDAFEDLKEDLKKNRYNPFREIYAEDGFQDQVREILASMISRSADEFEMLPVDENMDLLRNIIYAGIWSRFEEVFQKDHTPVS